MECLIALEDCPRNQLEFEARLASEQAYLELGPAALAGGFPLSAVRLRSEQGPRT